MPIEDIWDGTDHRFRQLQERLYGEDEYAGVAWRVIGWDSCIFGNVAVWADMRVTGENMRVHAFPPDMDLTNHRAFVAGTMPAAVYADWLEEQGVPICAEALAVLRHEAFAVA